MDGLELKNQIIEKAAAKGWTNQRLADESGVPVSTVAAIRSKNNVRVPNLDTAMRLMDALTKEEILEAEELENEWSDTMQQTNPNNLTPVEISHSLINLYERTIRNKDVWILVLAIMLAVLVLGVMGILVYDITHPDIGWFQRPVA